MDALARGRPHRDKLKELMAKKETIGDVFNQLRLLRQRFLQGRAGSEGFADEEALNEVRETHGEYACGKHTGNISRD